MALIRSLEDDRVKNLKSLSYGANQPLVTKDINKRPSPEGLGMQASRRIDDVARIAKFFTTPSGLKFVGNQALLQQVGLKDKITKAKEKGKTTGGAILQQVGKTALNTAALLGSTLAQVPVNGTGTHFFLGFKGKDSFYLSNTNKDFTGRYKSDFLGEDQKKFGPQLAHYSFNPPPKVIDFRDIKQRVGRVALNNRSYSFDYSDPKIKRETRVNLGDQARRSNISSYTGELEPGTIDGINMLPPIKLESASDRREIGVTKGRDLIKFRFEVITPDTSTILYFRAFLDQFNDSYNGDWSKNNYLGRGEAFYTYGGFDRSISLGFKIAAATRHEMQPLYQKMVFLASSTAPTYSSNFMRGTLVNLTVGDYVYNMPGFIEQVNYTWQTDYPWEIAFQNPEGDSDDDMQELPHVLDCQVNFKPIHNFTPQTGLYHYITNQYPGGGAARFFNIGGSTKPKPSSEIVGATNETAYRLKSQQQLDNDKKVEEEQRQKAAAEKTAREKETEEIFAELNALNDELLSEQDFGIPEIDEIGAPIVDTNIVSSTTGNVIDPASIRGT